MYETQFVLCFLIPITIPISRAIAQAESYYAVHRFNRWIILWEIRDFSPEWNV